MRRPPFCCHSRRVGVRRPALGPGIFVALVALYPVAWIVARPPGQPTLRFAAEVFGAEALLLLSCTLVLATLLAPIERAFSGLATALEVSLEPVGKQLSFTPG